MIPVLFAPNTREYNNNGLGVLVDVGYCTVTEERNGAFELELQYPVNGSHYSDLSVDCQILAKPNETSNPQAFRIYNISKPMNGVVTVSAEHISYELSSVLSKPFSASSVGEAFTNIKANLITESWFDFWTDKDTIAKFSFDIPSSARSLLGGVDGSILDVYGGEYEFDNYIVKLHENRGNDNGVTISYAKNLTGVKCEERSDGIVTGAVAYWTSESDGIVQTVYGDLQTIESGLSYSRNVVVDCSSEFEFPPSKSSLNEYAKNYINQHKNTPYFSVSVEFANLGDTEEYREYKGLYRVGLCDTVTVKHPLYGIDVKAKVVKTVFDSVREKYDKIQVGEISANISQTISTQEKELSKKVSQSALEKAIEAATNAITGNKGGYVVLNPPTNPQELLILDKPNVSEAVNVWRWNLAGLGHSNSGYNGDFTTAITADGQIVADFITTGTLSANRIKAGTLYSKNGFSYFSLDTGNATFGGSDYYTEIDAGAVLQYLQAGGGNIGGLVPIGDGNGFYQGLFYNSANANCKGITFGSRNASGTFDATVEIDKENGFNCFKKYSISDYGCISINDNGYMVFGSSSLTTSLWGQSVLVTTSTGNVRISSPSESIEIYAKKFINFDTDGTICIGEPYTTADGYKLLVSGNSFFDGDIYSSGDVSGATITNRSDRKIKKNIKKTNTKNALLSVLSLNIYDYDLKDSGKSVKMGLMADEAPTEILSDDGSGINLYSYCGMLSLAVKELSEKVDGLQKGWVESGRKN